MLVNYDMLGKYLPFLDMSFLDTSFCNLELSQFINPLKVIWKMLLTTICTIHGLYYAIFMHK